MALSNKQQIQVSKYLSLILRHKPEEGNLTLDSNGWADIYLVLKALQSKYPSMQITLDDLHTIVMNCPKQRYTINESNIRASQGHSVELEGSTVTEAIPPEILYHGTSTSALDSIYKTGINKASRNHVHLSADKETALNVGKRHGNSIVLEVDTKSMLEKGHKFYISDNGVWLTDFVPKGYFK